MRPSKRLTVAAIVAACAAGAAAPALAQDTRDGQIASAQAEKAKDLHPYVPTPAEERIQAVERILSNQPKFYPFIGSVFRGGLLAVGPGYRTRYAGTGFFDAHAAWSLKNYKAIDTSLKLPDLADGRVTIQLGGNWLDAPKVAFYGVGNETPSNAKVSFLYRTTTVGGSARVRAARFFAVGGGVDLLDVETGPGTSGTSIERRFTPADTAGLGAAPTYVRSRAFAEIDWRDASGYTRRGGLYRAEAFDYRQANTGPYSFRQVDLEADQFLPLLRENWVIALRAMASLTDTSSGNSVPYFLMPDLGGARYLRGYPSWRFRDNTRFLLTGEYRWTAGRFVDMALFLDAGQVAPRWSDVDFDRFKKSYGIGVRFHTSEATLMRVEVARTSEGTGLVFGFGPSF